MPKKYCIYCGRELDEGEEILCDGCEYAGSHSDEEEDDG